MKEPNHHKEQPEAAPELGSREGDGCLRAREGVPLLVRVPLVVPVHDRAIRLQKENSRLRRKVGSVS